MRRVAHGARDRGARGPLFGWRSAGRQGLRASERSGGGGSRADGRATVETAEAGREMVLSPSFP